MGQERFLIDFSIKMKLRFDNLLRNIDRFFSSQPQAKYISVNTLKKVISTQMVSYVTEKAV